MANYHQKPQWFLFKCASRRERNGSVLTEDVRLRMSSGGASVDGDLLSNIAVYCFVVRQKRM